MGLKIIISSAVKSDEKECVKVKLKDMRERHIINFDDNDLYDCNMHGAYLAPKSMQEKIDDFIKKVDWFICLIPEETVGKKTWEELKEILEAKRDGSPVIISVFHPFPEPKKDESKEIPVGQDENKDASDGRKPFGEVWAEAQAILDSKKEHYWVDYKHGDLDDLKTKVEEQYNNLYNNDKVFWSQHISYYAKPGGEVTAQELFFDRERASKECGFIEGENVYIYRKSVDGKMNLALDSFGLKFLFITGKPSSGKSRAMYEFLHSNQREKLVVVMKYENVTNICQNLQTEIEQLDKESDFGKTDYCFVCDQINDVFQKARVPKEQKLSFLRNISEQDNCWLIATGTKASLDNFIEDSEGIISSPDKKWVGGNSDLVSIPLISDDSESNEILERLRNRYAIEEGETIGDFITELNNYKRGIVDEVFDSTKKYKYLCDMLKSIQLTLNYRHITSLLLPINLLRQYFQNDDAKTFKEETIKCLDFLMNKNVIKITNTQEEEEISEFPPNRFSARPKPMKTEVDDEQYPKYVPNYYTFTVNELVWEYLEKCSLESSGNTILYNLFDCDELAEAEEFLFDSYPHVATLRRIVSRTPLRKKYLDKMGDDQRKRTAWEFSMEKLQDMNIPDEPQIEILKAFNILIGRSKNVEEIDKLLRLMKNNKVEIDDSTIGEMYRFAQRELIPETDDYRNFLEKTRALNKVQQLRDMERGYAWTYKDFYRIGREIALLSQNTKDYTYNKAFSLVSYAFSNLTYTTPEGTVLQKGKASVKAIGRQNNTIERRSLDALMVRLTKLCKTPKEIKQLIQCHQYYEIEPSCFVLHRIGRILKDSQKLKGVIKVLFPDKAAKINNAELYEMTIVSFVSHLKSFEESVELYKMWHDDLDMGKKHNSKLISLCLKNCGTEELQSAIAFIDTLPENAVNGITYNLLITIAGNTEDVLYLVKKMRPEDIDEYTLSNCLKCVETILQKNYGREVKKSTPLQIFLYAYEFINHPLLKAKRTRAACLQKLYRLTSDRYQEKYVNRLIKEVDEKRLTTLLNNDYINATRIMRTFRTFSDAWEEIYVPAKQKLDAKKGAIMPDLFNNMCAKYYKDLKDKRTDSQPKIAQYHKELQEDIERAITRNRIIQDEFFFLNYHIKFLGKALFTNDGDDMSTLFMDWFEGRTGNYDPTNIGILSRFIDYIIDMQETSGERKWRMACLIYGEYKQYFIKWNLHFKPSDAVYADLLKIVIDCEDKNEKLEWIDRELEEMDIDRTLKLNNYLNNLGMFYAFRYNSSHKRKENRQIVNLTRIDNAENSKEIIEVLQQEVNMEGFVAPSIFNNALEKFRSFQLVHAEVIKDFAKFTEHYLPAGATRFNLPYLVKKYVKTLKRKNADEETKLLSMIQHYSPSAKNIKNLRRELDGLKDKLGEEQCQEIIEFIKKCNLENSLTLRSIAILACLTKDNKTRIDLLKKLGQYNDISENSFGRLATEIVIGKTSITHSRMYFKKWLAIFRDIYVDDKAITDTLSKKDNEEKWNTLGLHFKHEVFALAGIHKRSHLPAGEKREGLYDYMKANNMTEVLDVIAEILRLYDLRPNYFKMKNFNQSISFENVIDLLQLHQPGNWQDVYNKLKVQNDVSSN